MTREMTSNKTMVIKYGFGENINPTTRDECELSSGREKFKQVK
jgi:hypothetical protein